MLFFFFSSRRRHTRLQGDWSSDVCSSDLLFVSVHADSIADRSISGASVYVLSVHGASSEAARWLAERENSADLVAGTRHDDQGALEPVLIDAAQSQMIGISATAA